MGSCTNPIGASLVERMRALPETRPEPEPFEVWREVCGLALVAVDEIERLRVDAERYRWLRERHQALCTMQAAQTIGLNLSKTCVQTPQQLDEVIDAAMLEDKP